jgi:hypothetical protein
MEAAQSSAVAGYLPVFTDASGTLGDSALFQVNTGTTTYLGFGTSTPSFNLHFVSQVDPAAITIDGYGTVGINFIGRRAEGTLAKPTALLAGDNIMAMQGRGYGLTGFSSASRAYMKFFAAENWTDSAQGTYISLATTLKGTAAAVERLRILDNGKVGIGTITPTSPLTVAGAIQSTSGGFIFPDGTVQTTAAKGAAGALNSSQSSSAVCGESARMIATAAMARTAGTTATAAKAVSIPGDSISEAMDVAQSSAVAGYLPVFTDASGTLGDSALFQVNTGTTTYLGFGTSTPSFNLHFVSQVDPAAITIDGYGTVGINFIGRRAEGTVAKPTALLAGDNIMAMQGRGYGLTGFSSASRAYMKFFAAENWTDSAQGTYISLATTLKGTAAAVERVRILDNGKVGIGTITPTSPLTVAGAIQSTSGGFIFPDGTVQTTAAK